MGQARHRQDTRQRHGRIYPQGKAVHRFLATLAGCVVACSAALAADGFDKNAAWTYLVKQCEFGPRVPGTEAHDKCRDYLLSELTKYTDNCRLQSFDYTWRYGKGQKFKLANVIGEQNWEHAKVHVVLTAHWDSRPFSDQDPTEANRNKPIIGADDGASGVAVLIELAKELKKANNPDVGIQYVLNDGEDLGPEIDEMLLGIDYYTAHLTVKPDYGILLDMIGNKGVRVPIEPTGYESSIAERHFVDEFYNVVGKAGLSKTFPHEYGPGVDDDHYPLIRAGIPTMDLIDFTFPWWHTQGDTVDKCDPKALGAIGDGLLAWFRQSKAYTVTR